MVNDKRTDRIINLFNQLSDRESEIIALRYGFFRNRRWTLERIAKRYNVTRERIRQIQSQSLKKLRKKFICPISPNEIPLFFSNNDKNCAIYLLSADLCKKEYVLGNINKAKYYIEKETYSNYSKIKKFINKLPKSDTFNKKVNKITDFGNQIGIPNDFLCLILDEYKANRNKTDIITEILEHFGYPMHYSEVYRIMSKTCNIDKQRNVLAIMQRREDLFVRVTNGVYALKNDDNPKSAPFIIKLIEEYFVKYKEGTVAEIYNYVISQRVCSFSSIPMYLYFNPKFEEIRKGVYALRDSRKHSTQNLTVRDVINTLFKEKEYIPIEQLINVVQREMPEVSISKLYYELNDNPEITVQDNFILKK
ncbi:MAG: hypothetical protein KBH94_06770 [Caldisericia bacterium]|nr:hypothetical protein [Caldisericia bacterium]